MGKLLNMGRVLAVFEDEELETAISGLQFAIDYVERREGDIDNLRHAKEVVAKMKRYRRSDAWPFVGLTAEEKTQSADTPSHTDCEEQL